MQARRPVGILGGMGPEATILLQRKLLDVIPAQDDCDHIPLLIDMNPQVPSRIAHLIDGSGDNPGPTLAAMARRLEIAGAKSLAMPCNTAHHYAPAIVDAVDIPLLNMIEIAATYAERALGPAGRVGMIASPAMRQTRLFEIALEARGLSVLWPKDDAAMLSAIRAIKKGRPDMSVRATVLSASSELLDAGADMQFIACSEFSLVADSAAPDARVVDTLDLLVAEIVAFSA